MVREIAGRFSFAAAIETGTYRGTSTEFFSNLFGCKIFTVEGLTRYFSYSSKRLEYDPKIHVRKGDSRTFLQDMRDVVDAESMTFFYLDAHWGIDLPLKEELEIIGSHWRNCVIMIDDFEVPHDPAYGYDNYGPGRSLTSQYVPWDALPGWEIFYPTLSGEEETGRRRGSCVIGSPSTLTDLAGCGTLRQIGAPRS